MHRARFVAALSAAEGQPGRVREMIVNSGEPVYRFNMWTGEEYFLRLSLQPEHVDFSRLVNGPLTINHDRSVESTVGVIERAWMEGAVLKASARFSEAESANEIWQKVEEGILKQVSVEANIAQTTKQKEKFDGLPLYVATKWSAEAVSIVPVGADRNAVLMSADNDPAALREMLKAAVAEALAEWQAPGESAKAAFAARILKGKV